MFVFMYVCVCLCSHITWFHLPRLLHQYHVEQHMWMKQKGTVFLRWHEISRMVGLFRSRSSAGPLLKSAEATRAPSSWSRRASLVLAGLLFAHSSVVHAGCLLRTAIPKATATTSMKKHGNAKAREHTSSGSLPAPTHRSLHRRPRV